MKALIVAIIQKLKSDKSLVCTALSTNRKPMIKDACSTLLNPQKTENTEFTMLRNEYTNYKCMFTTMFVQTF